MITPSPTKSDGFARRATVSNTTHFYGTIRSPSAPGTGNEPGGLNLASPTSRSLEALREMGYTAEVAERWIPHSRTRVDLAGVGDVLAWHPSLGILLVQATSGSNASKRMSKALLEPRLRTWLVAGGRFAVWSWRLAGAYGQCKRWTLRAQPVTMAMLND